MKELWKAWYGILPAQWCQNVIDRAKQRPSENGTVGFERGQHEDATYRSSDVRWLDVSGGEADIAAKMMAYVYSANRECFGVDIWDRMVDLQFTEYHAEKGGKYDWHHDVDFMNPAPHNRKLSIVVQLSDPTTYEGGDFEFNNMPQAQAFRLRGSVLVFPSFHLHRVLPVTAGSRCSLVSWIDGPLWR